MYVPCLNYLKTFDGPHVLDHKGYSRTLSLVKEPERSIIAVILDIPTSYEQRSTKVGIIEVHMISVI